MGFYKDRTIQYQGRYDERLYEIGRVQRPQGFRMRTLKTGSKDGAKSDQSKYDT